MALLLRVFIFQNAYSRKSFLKLKGFARGKEKLPLEASFRHLPVIPFLKQTGKDGVEKEIWYVNYENGDGKKVRNTFKEDQAAAQAFPTRSKQSIRRASVNGEITLLKHMCSKAIEWGKVKERPVEKVKFLKGEVKRVRFLLPEEIQKLLFTCADYLKPIVTVALNTGMRKGELLGLKWDQVNFEQGIISILESKNHERRDIPMNEMVMKALQGVERKGEYVFCSESGRPFVTLQSSFHAAVSKSGINDFRFHDLRHTFASNLVMEGVDIMTVKELLGTRT